MDKQIDENKLKQIDEYIKEAQTIIILGHKNPDGDAMGSALGIKHIIDERYNKEKEIHIVMTETQSTLSYLPGYEDILEKPKYDVYDLAIIVDLSKLDRINEEYLPVFKNAKKSICIDHHVDGDKFADIHIDQSFRPATTEIIYYLFKQMNYVINDNTLIALVTGLLTDTGGLRYPSTNEDSLDMAKEVLKRKLNLADLFTKSIYTISKNRFKIEQKAMQRTRFYSNDRIALTYLTNNDAEYVEREPGDDESVVNIARSVEGVEISVYLKEIDEGYKVSMRSQTNAEVYYIAKYFGGGGHKQAAAFEIICDKSKINIEDIIQKIVEVSDKYLDTLKVE